MYIYSRKIQHNYFIYSICTKSIIHVHVHVWNNWYICVFHPIVSVVSFILAKFQSSKRPFLREKKRIKISCGHAFLYIMFLKTTKCQEILLRGFRGFALTNCFSCIFHFGQVSKFKKGVIPRKNWFKFPVDMHIHMVCPSQQVSGNSVERF